MTETGFVPFLESTPFPKRDLKSSSSFAFEEKLAAVLSHMNASSPNNVKKVSCFNMGSMSSDMVFDSVAKELANNIQLDKKWIQPFLDWLQARI